MQATKVRLVRGLLVVILTSLILLPHPALGRQTPVSSPPSAPGIPDDLATPIADRAGDTDPVLYDAILPEHRERIYRETAGLISRYRIGATLQSASNGKPPSIGGTVNLIYVNESASPQEHVFLRLYPNDPAYNEAEMRVDSIAVNNVAVETALSENETVLSVPLPEPLAAGADVAIDLTYSAVIPIRPARTYGIFAIDPESGTTSLAHWFPMLAGVDDSGWSLEPVSRNGDPIFSNVALFDVSLTTPADVIIAATGVELGRQSDAETITRRFVSGPSRDFTVVASPSFATASREVNGTTITSYFLPESAAGGEAVVDFGERSLTLFGSLLSPYPYRELDLVEVELYGAAGVEFPQLVFLAHTIYGGSPRNEHYLEFVTAHEVVHQWLYGLIGNNQYREAFIDEGLSEYLSSDVYFSATYGPETGRRQFALEVLHWYLSSLQSGQDVVVDQPTDDFSSVASYSVTVYAKGAIGFARIRAQIGDEAFFAALRDYAARYEFSVASPADLRAAFEAASGQDVEKTWRTWFEEARGTETFSPDDYDELLVELGLR